TTLSGLDMPTVSEVQQVFIQAASGTYRLRIPGYGRETGLPNTAGIVRFTGYAEVTLDYALDAPGVQALLRQVYGTSDLIVSENRTNTDVTYTISFVRTLAGRDFAPIEWGDTRGTTLLVPAPNASINVLTRTVRDGSVQPARDTLQTLTILAGAGKFRLGARLDPNDNSVVTWTAAIPFDASAADVLATLSAILNPNNTNPALPFTDNVAVSRHGNVYHILLQGQYRRLMLLPTDHDVS